MSTKPMKVLVRADASTTQGSGHVMRCMTLARELARRGHDVELAVTIDGIPWLADVVAASGLRVVTAVAGELDADGIRADRPDWVVVDSYVFDAADVASLVGDVSVLAIVDGDLRGIRAALFVDQNLGAERNNWSLPPASRMLAGAAYALVRDEIRAARRSQPWHLDGPPHVVAFMGGTDATGAIVDVARRLAALDRPIHATVIARDEHRVAVQQQLASLPGSRVLPPSPELHTVLADADIVVSAAGTSAWEVGTLGLPAVLLAVVDNQRASLSQAVERGVVLGVDLVDDHARGYDELSSELRRLCDDEFLRRSLSEKATQIFDGRGAARVAEAMERV